MSTVCIGFKSKERVRFFVGQKMRKVLVITVFRHSVALATADADAVVSIHPSLVPTKEYLDNRHNYSHYFDYSTSNHGMDDRNDSWSDHDD
jgi:hypothetical protein